MAARMQLTDARGNILPITGAHPALQQMRRLS